MKKLAVFVIIVLGLTAIGWLTFNLTGNNPSVEIDTDKIQSDTKSIVDEGKELIHDTGEALREADDDQTK